MSTIPNNLSRPRCPKQDLQEPLQLRFIDFSPAGRVIGHQVLIERSYVFPHTVTVASDSHSNMYGGIGFVGTQIRVVRTDAPALKTWAVTALVQQTRTLGSMLRGQSAA